MIQNRSWPRSLAAMAFMLLAIGGCSPDYDAVRVENAAAEKADGVWMDIFDHRDERGGKDVNRVFGTASIAVQAAGGKSILSLSSKARDGHDEVGYAGDRKGWYVDVIVTGLTNSHGYCFYECNPHLTVTPAQSDPNPWCVSARDGAIRWPIHLLPPDGSKSGPTSVTCWAPRTRGPN